MNAEANKQKVRDMQIQLEAFVRYLGEQQNRSKNTQLSYERDIRQLLGWLAERRILHAEEVSPQDLRAYVSHLTASGRGAATISRCVASTRAFFQYLLQQDVLVRDPSEALRAPKVLRKAPIVLTQAEIQRLLAQPDERTPKGLRDKAMLELLCDTGLRVSELIGLSCSEVDLPHRMLVVQAARQRLVPYSRRIAALLSRYEREARPELTAGVEQNWFFVNCTGEGMTRQGFWKLLKKYGKEAGIEKAITPHVMRHSFAVRALAGGEDVHKLQQLMGHRDMSAMHGYMLLSEQSRR